MAAGARKKRPDAAPIMCRQRVSACRLPDIVLRVSTPGSAPRGMLYDRVEVQT
jgi:hypothetical protein